jgi:hypothetical protein
MPPDGQGEEDFKVWHKNIFGCSVGHPYNFTPKKPRVKYLSSVQNLIEFEGEKY